MAIYDQTWLIKRMLDCGGVWLVIFEEDFKVKKYKNLSSASQMFIQDSNLNFKKKNNK